MQNERRLTVLPYLLTLLSLSALSGSAVRAAEMQGHGRVSLWGSIIETPCAVDTQSRDQSIDMGVTPTAIIARDGQGPTRPFSIRLVNCTLAHLDSGRPDWRYFKATFDGQEDNGRFAVTGEARGVALEVADSSGNIAHPGAPLSPGRLMEGDQQLDYTLRLVGDRKVLRAGDFRAILRFRMDYF